MLLNEIPSIDATSSILFLGSGFSIGSLNQEGSSPPNGAKLKEWIEDRLNLPSPTAYDLRVLSDELIDKNPTEFARKLRDIFRIKELNDTQRVVLNQDWRRIYTTNYDDLVEHFFTEARKKVTTYDIADKFENKLSQGAIIHLHGSVRKVSEENLRSSLVLGETSYVSQMLHESRWYDQFLRDIAFADHIFFVGYSLSDYLISSLINQNSATAEKTTFILKGPIDGIEANRIGLYGAIEQVGSEGFASWLQQVPRKQPASDINSLKAFRPLSPDRDKKAAREPTAREVYEMLVFGNFDPGRLASSLPGDSYVIRRRNELNQAKQALSDTKTLLIDSRIGNGKTVFLHLLAAELAELGHKPFLFRPGHPAINQEIHALSSVEKVVIFFERYGDAEDALPDLATSLPKAKFVSEIRTALFEVRFHDLGRVTGGNYKRVSMNALSKPDEQRILSLAQGAGIPLGSDRKKNYGELRYLLIDVFNNPTVQDRIKDQLSPLFQNTNLRKILACTFLLGRNHTKFGLELLRAIYGFDPFVELKDSDGLSAEIFEFDSDGFRMRSALLSDFLLKVYIKPDEIADAAARLIRYSADRRDIRAFRALLSELMAFGNLYPAFGGDEHATTRIIGLYEDLRHDERTNSDPLFWLQFAIASAENGQTGLAVNYLETAYERAELVDGFQTYQIDTQAFRLYLLQATASNEVGPVKSVDRILELFETMESMLREDSNRFHAVKVLENIRPFLEKRKVDLSANERMAFSYRLNSTSRTLRALPVEFRARAGADSIADSLATSATSIAI